jgi:hypothetical protein
MVIFRYFSGVQGDKTRQGELFGVKNIFKLHESGLATKAAVPRLRYSFELLRLLLFFRLKRPMSLN